MRAAVRTRAANDFLARWARTAVRNRGKVLLAWIGGLIAITALWQSIGGRFPNPFEIPAPESPGGADLLQHRFPAQAGDSAVIVVQADAGLRDPAVRCRVT